MSSDLLLTTRRARELYHGCASSLPIIDYHSHLNPVDLASDRQFEDVTSLWIAPDQYKHRAMRTLGVPERFIKGDASPAEKFEQWAGALPLTVGNPLFHWSALELERYFGVTEPLNERNAGALFAHCNQMLQQPTHRARQLLSKANVEFVCTSDALLDDLGFHVRLAESGYAVRVIPSLRADDALAVESPTWGDWIKRLGSLVGIEIRDLESYEAALAARIDAFAEAGCFVSDHGIDDFGYVSVAKSVAADRFRSRLAGETLSLAEQTQLRSHLLEYFGREYARRGWAMQLHLGAQRTTSSRLKGIAGVTGGYATIGRQTDVAMLCRLLDALETSGGLPRTILYSLNPADYAAFACVTGSFAEEGVVGKIQMGPAWWFNDHDLGIKWQLDAISRYGLLSASIGMTTDSRSLLSMTRHDYYRRVFCDYLADQIEAGLFPDDAELQVTYVRRVCYENARRWFSSNNS